jgi:hypothetical protein
MSIVQLEHRVAELELKLTHLAEKMDASAPTDINAWIDDIHGTFQNNATYRKGARLGRQWRKSHSRSGKASIK